MHRMKRTRARPAPVRWAVQWVTRQGPEYIIWHRCLPLLFRNRREARAWIQEHYGYIKTRPDLRTSPHNWRLPRAVRVAVILKEMP